jgi:hypothetical protein
MRGILEPVLRVRPPHNDLEPAGARNQVRAERLRAERRTEEADRLSCDYLERFTSGGKASFHLVRRNQGETFMAIGVQRYFVTFRSCSANKIRTSSHSISQKEERRVDVTCLQEIEKPWCYGRLGPVIERECNGAR